MPHRPDEEHMFLDGEPYAVKVARTVRGGVVGY